MKLRIKPEIWKIRKQKTPNDNSKKKKKFKNGDSVRSLRNDFKYANICIMGVPEGGERTRN